MVRLISDFPFDTTQLHRITISVDPIKHGDFFGPVRTREVTGIVISKVFSKNRCADFLVKPMVDTFIGLAASIR